MTPRDIEALAQVLQRHSITACEVQEGDAAVRLQLQPCAPEPVVTAPPPYAAPILSLLYSPGMGCFVSRHPLQGTPAATPGQRVEAGQTVGYLRIGSLIEEITAQQTAVLGQQLVEEGALVGYGIPLFELT